MDEDGRGGAAGSWKEAEVGVLEGPVEGDRLGGPPRVWVRPMVRPMELKKDMAEMDHSGR